PQPATGDMPTARMHDDKRPIAQTAPRQPELPLTPRCRVDDQMCRTRHRRDRSGQLPRQCTRGLVPQPHVAVRKTLTRLPGELARIADETRGNASPLQQLGPEPQIAEPGRAGPAAAQPGDQAVLIGAQPVRHAPAADQEQLAQARLRLEQRSRPGAGCNHIHLLPEARMQLPQKNSEQHDVAERPEAHDQRARQTHESVPDSMPRACAYSLFSSVSISLCSCCSVAASVTRGTYRGGPTATAIRAKGAGMTNLSHLMSQAREAA